MDTQTLSLADIEEARETIRGAIYLTPLTFSKKLSERTGARVYLKLENLQHTGSFKERGALNKLQSLSPDECASGIFASSAGNHAQGVAYHCQKLGLDATIVMPRGTPLVKVASTQSFGATVVLEGENYDEAYAHARDLCAAANGTFIHPFDDFAIMAGQGTIGLEVLEQNPYLDAIVVPVGGGGLISGIAVALKEINPRIRVIGVEATVLPSMQNSLYQGKVVRAMAASTVADGIAVQEVGQHTLATAARYVDEIVTVTEEEIAAAVLYLLEQEKTVAEGAGATAVAAMLTGRVANLEKKRVALVISGGNIDVNVISRIIQRGLAQNGRLVEAEVVLDDAPGALARLTAILAELAVNIIEIHHSRVSSDFGRTVVMMTLETKGFEHIERLRIRLGEEELEVRSLSGLLTPARSGDGSL